MHFKLHLKYAFQIPFKICISNSSLSPHFLTKVLSYSIPTQTPRLLIFYSNHSSTHSLLKPLILYSIYSFPLPVVATEFLLIFDSTNQILRYFYNLLRHT